MSNGYNQWICYLYTPGPDVSAQFTVGFNALVGLTSRTEARVKLLPQPLDPEEAKDCGAERSPSRR